MAGLYIVILFEWICVIWFCKIKINSTLVNIGVVLEKIRGKRVVFVGDSWSRTQWESLICFLMNGVDKTTVYEYNENKISKKD